MYKYVAIFVVLFSVSSAQAGVLADLGRLATGNAFSYWLSRHTTAKLGVGLAASMATSLAAKTADDALMKPVFNWEAPRVDLKGLGFTAAGTAAEHYAVPAMTQGAMYLLGMSAMTNPYSALFFGLVSQFAVGKAMSIGIQSVS